MLRLVAVREKSASIALLLAVPLLQSCDTPEDLGTTYTPQLLVSAAATHQPTSVVADGTILLVQARGGNFVGVSVANGTASDERSTGAAICMPLAGSWGWQETLVRVVPTGGREALVTLTLYDAPPSGFGGPPSPIVDGSAGIPCPTAGTPVKHAFYKVSAAAATPAADAGDDAAPTDAADSSADVGTETQVTDAAPPDAAGSTGDADGAT